MAASLTAQALAVGLLLFIPLIYNERLPDVRPWTPLTLPLRPLPPQPEPIAAAKPSSSTRPSFATRPTFHLPTSPTQADYPVVTTLAAPSLDSGPLSIGVPDDFGPAPFPRFIAVSPPPTTLRPPEKPRPVGGDVQAAKIIRRVTPAYPALARQARISGTVRLVGVIARDGTIQRLEVESGHPLLIRAALDAVRQWVYRPTLLNGEAVEVIAPIDVIFTLSQ